MNNQKIKFGVVGVGHLGKHHVKHLAKFDFIDLIGIYDINVVEAQEVANIYNVPIAKCVDQLLKESDAISILAFGLLDFIISAFSGGKITTASNKIIFEKRSGKIDVLYIAIAPPIL